MSLKEDRRVGMALVLLLVSILALLDFASHPSGAGAMGVGSDSSFAYDDATDPPGDSGDSLAASDVVQHTPLAHTEASSDRHAHLRLPSVLVAPTSAVDDVVRRPIDGAWTSVDDALEAGQRFVGSGADELAPGVFRSASPNADGSFNVFRMTADDLSTNHAVAPHVNFEIHVPNGRGGFNIAENIHVFLSDFP